MVDQDRLARETFTIVLAGGRGSRLDPLTRRQCKPALPFAARHRNIDFTLSNCVNSGLRRIALPAQYCAQSLADHIARAWSGAAPSRNAAIDVWPAQQRLRGRLYAGTADAVYRNLDSILMHRPRRIVVLAGDHVYAMDYRPMLAEHIERGADATVACLPVPVAASGEFGVLEPDARGRVRCFVEKPAPASLDVARREVLASMGIYVFDTDWLVERLREDAVRSDSAHDFGRDVLPRAVRSDHVAAYRFIDAQGRACYWRDVGTIEVYWRAHMELLGGDPPLDLHDPRWPIHSGAGELPPAQLRYGLRRPVVTDSMLGGGVLVQGATVIRSVLGNYSSVGEASHLEEVVALPGARIGRMCRLQRVIIDSAAVVPDGTCVDHDDDRIGVLTDAPGAGELRSVA